MSWFPVSRRPLAALLISLVLAGCESMIPSQGTAPAEVVDPSEIVVLMPRDRAPDALLAGAAARGFRLREETALGGLDLRMLSLDIPPPLDGAGAIAVLEALEPSATAGVNHAFRPAQTEPGSGALDYAGPLIGWPGRACHARTPVGMIDTGVDASGPELAGVRVLAENFAEGRPAATRHGTEVASVLGDPRRVSDLTLYSAAVVGDGSRGEEAGVDRILEALDWLAANDVTLVNVSLSGPYNKLLDRGMGRAETLGMRIVAAAGNEGASAGARFPAALPAVIAVTAVDAERALYDRAVTGSHIDVAAPGVDVAVHMGGRMHFVTGTSIAAPFATALIAVDPDLASAPVAHIRNVLRQTSEDLGQPGPDALFGAGLLTARGSC